MVSLLVKTVNLLNKIEELKNGNKKINCECNKKIEIYARKIDLYKEKCFVCINKEL